MKVRNLVSRILFVALMTVGVGVAAHGQTVADVDAVVQKAIAAKAIPGAGVAVLQDGKVVNTKKLVVYNG